MTITPATRTPFRHQPKWVLPVLVLVLAIAGCLYAWRLGASGLSTYYAAAAKAMSETWPALATGAINPSAAITLDKLAGFLVPQAVAAHLFGFHAWSLDLPQAIEGVITVLASYVIGARWRGPRVGIAAAALVTVTPIAAAMFGHPTEDAMLTMTLVLAFAAWQRSVISGHSRWLLLAAFWVAVGFQAKMLQAWIIVPAVLIGALIVSRGSWPARLLRIGAVGMVTAILSLSWMTAIQLVPAADRPYIDGSTNNSTYSMVFAYNGLDRFSPGLIAGGVPQLGSQTGPRSGAGKGTATGLAAHSHLKLLMPQFTTQDGWLAPAAIAGMAFGLAPFARRRRRVRTTDITPKTRPDALTDRAAAAAPEAATAETATAETMNPAALDRVMIVTLSLWAVITAAVFSLIWVPHASYLGALAVPVALLAVFGGTEAIRMFTEPGRARHRAALPVLVAVQTAWQLSVISTGPVSLRWLLPIVGVLGGLAALALIAISWRASRDSAPPPRRRGTVAVIALALVSSLIAPVVWSSFVLGPGGSGSAADSYAGPKLAADGSSPAAASSSSPKPHTVAATPTDTLPAFLAELRSRNGGRQWLFATDTLPIAVDVLLTTNSDVLPMGGFSQQAPSPSTTQLRALISRGELRFVLLSDPRETHPPNVVLAQLRSWVRAHCVIDHTGHYREGSRSQQLLYDCAP